MPNFQLTKKKSRRRNALDSSQLTFLERLIAGLAAFAFGKHEADLAFLWIEHKLRLERLAGLFALEPLHDASATLLKKIAGLLFRELLAGNGAPSPEPASSYEFPLTVLIRLERVGRAGDELFRRRAVWLPLDLRSGIRRSTHSLRLRIRLSTTPLDRSIDTFLLLLLTILSKSSF